MGPTAHRRNARGPRDRQAFEHVRMQAGVLFAAGRSQAHVARQNTSRWRAILIFCRPPCGTVHLETPCGACRPLKSSRRLERAHFDAACARARLRQIISRL